MDRFEIYTDGSCDNLQYPNYGGWAYLILENGEEICRRSGTDIHTTNNRMEMLAIINSLVDLPIGSIVELYTDSKYCIGCFTGTYKAIANTDLIEDYQRIVEEQSLTIHFNWVKGHNGDKYNEIVDKLSNEEYERISGKVITDYKRMKKDADYRKEVCVNSKRHQRNKALAELIESVLSDTREKNKYYIHQVVLSINELFQPSRKNKEATLKFKQHG